MKNPPIPALPTVPAPTLAIANSTDRFPIRRVFCIGRNYPWPGSATLAGTPREAPFFFMKPADTVVPAQGLIAYPPLSEDFCHEIELVVAIGKAGVNVPPEAALDHVWGYAAGLDLTRRDLQLEAKQAGRPWEGAKAFDASAPCSPLVPAPISGHPTSGTVWLAVNGDQRQHADLAELIWPVHELISFLSRSVTLQPGDLVFTGTPAGVAALLPGDVIEAGIEGVAAFSVTIAPR
ncbi:fumarylacetoacetate hydrolase family protein [Ideonella azotifigens]|uniref:Fumarylacetoacetate hydrolase family protein n=1 Tax=Ideonella azotifigens TaxID=513160 RepID=A0ABN1K2R3_9BURK|nr:fumarylacetoacetate hydrolase family protein [Ideonella azotifigens]MCD2344579.1 fumarylacetoacetate hydrolase family protein [Ideonella azotifigens]